mgnify:CR=1 FL=1
MNSFNHGTPTAVDFQRLFELYPQHHNCHLFIATSAKNSTYRGLYCCQHQRHLMWINPRQEAQLRELGITESQTRL